MPRGPHRRIIGFVPVGLLALTVGACSSDDDTTTTTTTAVTSASATTTAPPASAVPTSAPAPTTVTTTTPPIAYPGAAWDTIDPPTAGFDTAALDRLAVDAEAGGSTCTAVVRDGRLVDARSWGPLGADTPREAWSVTKSVTSTLIGIAQDQGLLTVDDQVSAYVPEWRGTPSEAVTIRDILSNASGRHWDSDTDYVQMAARADDKTAFAIALGQDAAPGEVWAYNNSAIQVLEAVLEAATGESPADYAARVLFTPLGMSSSHLTTDAAGNALTYAGLQTTCTDLARFGYLMLHDGEWAGTQIVPAAYVAQATGEPSTDLNAAYGWLWWLNHRGPIGSPLIATRGPGDGSVADGQFLPGQSEADFWALGLFDQVVAVIPDEGIVAVRMGDEPPADAPFGMPELTLGVLGATVTQPS